MEALNVVKNIGPGFFLVTCLVMGHLCCVGYSLNSVSGRGGQDQYSEMPFSLSAFRRALERSGIELPSGQASHALRHTFASHFVMQGGNMLVLQRVLGHSSINITMRYAHLAPEHFQEAVMLSPVNSVRHIFDMAPPQNAESP